MKNYMVFFLILLCNYSWSQEQVDYRVKQKPLPIMAYADGRILTKVPRNKVLTMLSYNDSCDCFNVKYKKHVGLVSSELWLDDAYQENDTAFSDRNKMLAAYEERLSMARAATLLKRKSYLIKKYGYSEGIKVSEGKIWLGMTVDMTLDSRGIPFKVNRSSTNWGPREQWIYSDTYLYFENGILAEILTIKRNNNAYHESP
jgi:hypothetical protein